MAPDDSGWLRPAPERRADAGRGRIRCPRCKWQPGRHERWSCDCGHAWNTFETRGKCPACDRQWHETQCPRCGVWSPHADWYAPA